MCEVPLGKKSLYFVVTSVSMFVAACWMRGVSTSSPSDFALPLRPTNACAQQNFN